MAAQLTCDPIIKITLTSNEVFDEVAPGYVLDNFVLTKGLLKPNKLQFVLRREELTLEPSDIDFELRDKLLTAMVEVSLKARYYDVEADEMVDYDVEDFFYGYIQNIKLYCSNGSPVTFKCVAYSPDAKMKHHPTCISFVDTKLEGAVNYVTSVNVMEKMTHFDKKEGTYSEPYNYLESIIEPEHQGEVMPYTVQYRESPYNFLKRLARRYAEFMYYENRKFVFGKMQELPEIVLHNGTDLEKYSYEMNMNDHDGTVLVTMDTFNRGLVGGGFQKKPFPGSIYTVYQGIEEEDGYQNEMAKSTYRAASDYFGDAWNSIEEMGAMPLYDRDRKEVGDEYEFKKWHQTQHEILERYVMSDALTCRGTAARVDLKLGSILKIKDLTKNNEKNDEWKEHTPLKVVELMYYWNSEDNLAVQNRFKAIPKDVKVPPYLERDKDGFLVYGDFDQYPKCGPHYGIVVDNDDPDHLGRVKVALSWQLVHSQIASNTRENKEIVKNKDNITPWIWVVSPYQGFSQGSLAVPEIGSMVLVGFVHNNAERPYVMGARYYKDIMRDDWTKYDQNRVKGFRTRSGHTIEFIDAKGNNGYEGFEKGGRIHIYDAETHSYDIYFDTDQKLIKMTSKGNIELYADKDIIMEAGNDVRINADNDLYLYSDKHTQITSGENMSLQSNKAFSASSKNDFSATSKANMNFYSEEDIDMTSIENTQVNVSKEFKMGVGKEFSVDVSKSITVNGEDEGQIKMKKTLTLGGQDIVLDARNELQEYSKDHCLKAQNGVKLNATSCIELQALTIKEN